MQGAMQGHAEFSQESQSYEKSAKKAEEMHAAMLVQSFFNRTSSQLTEHGLLKLHEVRTVIPTSKELTAKLLHKAK